MNEPLKTKFEPIAWNCSAFPHLDQHQRKRETQIQDDSSQSEEKWKI